MRVLSRGDDLVEADERAAADEEDVRRVDLDVFLVWVLAPALRRNAADGPLDDLQERLLNTLAAHVAGDRDIVGLRGDLVDLVDVDDAALGELHVAVRVLKEVADKVLDILADVAGLREDGRVADGERHAEHLCERPGEKRLAAPRGPDEEDVRLLNLHVREGIARPLLLRRLQTAVVVVDSDGEDFLHLVVADDILIQERLDLLGRGRGRQGLGRRLGRFHHHGHGRGGGRGGPSARLRGDDLVEILDALDADPPVATRQNRRLGRILLPAERAPIPFFLLLHLSSTTLNLTPHSELRTSHYAPSTKHYAPRRPRRRSPPAPHPPTPTPSPRRRT